MAPRSTTLKGIQSRGNPSKVTMANNNHRYTLTRDWKGGLHYSAPAVVNFIMLNPSTADDVFDDPTIRRCIGFAKRWEFHGIVVTNLFAYRATDPRELIRLAAENMPIAIGEENDEHIAREASNARAVVLAWGDHADRFPERRTAVIDLVSKYNPHCIRLTKSGNPAHPVREKYTDRSVPFFRPTDSPERR
jgi:hypothetical protein